MRGAAGFSRDMTPPSAKWLGMDLIEHDPQKMYSKVSFEPNKDMINFGGVIQGGFLGAMMDDAMGFNTFISLNMKFSMATIDLSTQFLRAVPFDTIIGEAWVTKSGKAIAFTEAKLYIGDNELAARATSSLKLRPFEGLQFETS